MISVILTLQYPKGLKGLPIATTNNISALRFFKQAVLEDWQKKIEEASDEGEELLFRLEYQRLKTALHVFIPEESSRDEELP